MIHKSYGRDSVWVMRDFTTDCWTEEYHYCCSTRYKKLSVLLLSYNRVSLLL